MDIEIASY